MTLGHYCPRLSKVKGAEFERRVRKLARGRKLTCQFVADKGKGSHGRLYLGNESTTLKDRKKEIGRDLLGKFTDVIDVELDEATLLRIQLLFDARELRLQEFCSPNRLALTELGILHDIQ